MFNSVVGFERDEEIKLIFGMIDTDKSGYICLSELRDIWKG